MGAEFVVGSLEEMCDLMCNNTIPKRKEKKKMTRIAEIVINNCPSNVEGWEVARLTEDGFYHFGTYETAERAAEVAEELGEGAIVARLID